MTEKNEILLGSWLRLSTSINNSRLVSDMSFSESLVCNILYRNHIAQNGQKITATDLCTETKMLKSQMNRTLNQLEARNMITRERAPEDKRKVYIRLNTEQAAAYHAQHEKILALLDAIMIRLGEQGTDDAITLFDRISDIADELLHAEN